MMLTAMQHLDSTAYAYASPSSASSSPWKQQQQQQQQQILPEDRGHLLYDYDLIGSAPAPPSAPAAVQHAPASRHQHRAARRVAKRRPRPSRRLPVTYISAGPAEFRRMVQQVTGADDLLLPQQQEELLYRPAGTGRAAASAAGHAGAGTLPLPTLDTSAFLLGRARPAAARTTEAPPPPPSCDGSLALDNTSSSSNRGFPTLESWDL